MQADEHFRDQTSSFDGEAPLNQAVGYSVLLGFGAFFALFSSFITYLNIRYNNASTTSEEFNTAGRNVKTGLTACGIVSTWTWAATILQSANVAFRYGISGPFWYAAGASIQVLLFGILAIEVKRKARNAHTIGEIVLSRWGHTAHKCFLGFFFVTHTLVISMLILGGAAVTSAITGVNYIAASFLLPVGFIVYTLVGGLKATFIAGYINVVIIYLIMCIFIFEVYVHAPDLGSAEEVWKRVRAVMRQSDEECEAFGYDPETQTCGGIHGNYEGSYLTILSVDGLMFGIINLIGNFGTVFCDQTYWQSAIAADPSAAHKGYLLGGLCWFAIPFSFATAMGIANVALQLPTSFDEANSGLVPAATAIHLFGDSGGVMMLVLLFMAVISTGSAELVGVSSLVAYDIYREYFNRDATGDDILRISRYVILITGCLMGALSVLLNQLGISLGWVYLFMGILIGSAVYPIWCCLTCKQSTCRAALSAVFGGQALALVVWLVTCSIAFGEVTVNNLGENTSMLAGNLTALFSSYIIMKIVTVLNPDDYNWDDMNKNIKLVEQDLSGLDPSLYDETTLDHANKWIVKWGFALTLLLVVAWPILAIPAGSFSESYFAFWIAISFIWCLVATVIMILLPVWEDRESLLKIAAGILGMSASKQDPALGTELMHAGAEKSESGL